MDIHEEEKDEFDQLDTGLDVLLQIQIHDDSIESKHSDQFEKTKQLELFG